MVRTGCHAMYGRIAWASETSMSQMAAVTARPIRSILRMSSMRGRACRTSRFDNSSVKMPQASARQMITTSRGVGTTSLKSTSRMRSFTSRSASPSMSG